MQLFSTLAVLATLAVSAFSAVVPAGKTIVDIASSDPQFSTLVSLLGQFPDLVAALSDENAKFTVFAPTNDAFGRLPAVPPKDVLKGILQYHVLPGVVASGDLSNGLLLETLFAPATLRSASQRSKIEINGDKVRVDNANIIAVDVFASNGVIHVVDDVLIPPVNAVEIAAATPALSTLVSALQYADLVDAVKEGPFTIFAPTDAAFAKLPLALRKALFTPLGKPILASILKFHVVPAVVYAAGIPKTETQVPTLLGFKTTAQTTAAGVVINGNANVAIADVLASNGVVHVIDTVLIPRLLQTQITTLTAAKTLSTSSFASAGKTIVDIAASLPQFSTLVTLLSEFPDLVAALSDENGEFTVFAPTNDAFAKLPAVPPKDVLKTILQYHVLGSKVLSTDLSNGLLVPTLYQPRSLGAGSQQIKVTIDGKTVKADNANIIQVDVIASNGVIHVIDEVLAQPPNAVDVAIAGGFTTLVQALTFTGLADVVASSPSLTIFAPTDAAFAKLPANVAKFLFSEKGKPTLANILKYHVVASVIYSAGIPSVRTPVATLLGKNVIAKASNGKVTINGKVNVIAADVLASQGVIHVIDTVLIPPASSSLLAEL